MEVICARPSSAVFSQGGALESGKQPAGQPAAAVVVNSAIGLAEFRGRRHGAAPNPYCLKTEAARALTSELLVLLRHIYKIARHAFSVKYQKGGKR